MQIELTRTLAFGLPGHWEWVVIGMIALLLLGSRLPQVARSVGDGIREFKKGLKDVGDEVKSAASEEVKPNPYAQPPLNAGGEDPRVASGRPSETAQRAGD